MHPLLIAILAGIGFVVAYNTYGRWLGRKIFNLSANAVCPSHRLQDGVDYVPTSRAVVFGHHFTSIAGTGPIVGPAIAIMWGWLPALLWVLFGSIFIGAVHDLGSLVVSLRNNGQTVGDIAGRLINRRVRILFLLVLFMALTLVLAVFGMVIASAFQLYPASIFPCTIQLPIAVIIGYWIYRQGGGILIPSIITLALMYLSVIYGDVGILHTINSAMAAWPIWLWVVLLLVYSYIASVLPVWVLLQPRDYINSLQLISALGLIVVGLIAASIFGGHPPVSGAERPALSFVAPVTNIHLGGGAPAILPFLFITVACGAISGFHCLVSSGTSSKQLKTEPDARMVGYGSMLMEGFLATLVILACAAGIGLGLPLKVQQSAGGTQAAYMMADGVAVTAQAGDGVVRQSAGETVPLVPGEAVAFNDGLRVSPDGREMALVGPAAYATQYPSWKSSEGLKSTVGAFVTGAGNFINALGIPMATCMALMGVLVASFAGTTMDTACRLQRYVIQELAIAFAGEGGRETLRDRLTANPLTWLANKHGATILAVALAAVLAALPAPGKTWSAANAGSGGLILWPLFGAVNQLLGGLAFLVISFYLWRRGKPVWFIVIPMVFMLIMPAWAMLINLPVWWKGGRVVLSFIALATLLLEAWMVVEALLMFPRVRDTIEHGALDQTPVTVGAE